MSDTFHERIEGITGTAAGSEGAFARFLKRGFDIALVLAALPIVLLPLALLLALVALDGGAPLYAQWRVGRHGTGFRCWKIRTMVRDADGALAALIAADPAVAAEWAHRQKLEDDPRITRLGRLLRRSSLDELPQLWNVLCGQMSLIGPRPFTPEQRALYDRGNTARAYYRLRPGLSGAWQIGRRNSGSFAERLGYDEDYAAQLSLANDLRIVLATIAVVMRGTGR